MYLNTTQESLFLESSFLMIFSFDLFMFKLMDSLIFAKEQYSLMQDYVLNDYLVMN